MQDVIFKRKKPNINKLTAFGFTQKDGIYTYQTSIVNSQFILIVDITEDGKITTQVIDKEASEEYVLHNTAAATGVFVGMVRADYEAVLSDIEERCFEPDIFKNCYTERIVSYARETYNDELEFLWKKTPENAILRRKDTGKWYAALLTLSKRKLGINSDEIIEILDLRGEPEHIKALIDNKIYFPGYHMNKKHWFTICMDGSVPAGEVFRLIDKSYELANK